MNPLMKAMQSMNLVGKVLSAYKNGTLDQLAEQEFKTNPKFREFVEQNKGKSNDQIAKEVGFDEQKFKNMI